MALLVGSVIQLTLNLFGAAFGLAAIAPALEQRGSARGVATQAMAWWFASSLLSLIAAGFIAGWLRQATGLNDTAIYVSTVWALTTWWRSGSQSRSLVQPRAVPTGRPAPPPEVVIRFEGRGQGLVAGDAVALRPHRVARPGAERRRRGGARRDEGARKTAGRRLGRAHRPCLQRTNATRHISRQGPAPADPEGRRGGLVGGSLDRGRVAVWLARGCRRGGRRIIACPSPRSAVVYIAKLRRRRLHRDAISQA
jgi:hypothetical protein